MRREPSPEPEARQLVDDGAEGRLFHQPLVVDAAAVGHRVGTVATGAVAGGGRFQLDDFEEVERAVLHQIDRITKKLGTAFVPEFGWEQLADHSNGRASGLRERCWWVTSAAPNAAFS